jgi:hypothetical protein
MRPCRYIGAIITFRGLKLISKLILYSNLRKVKRENTEENVQRKVEHFLCSHLL